MNNGRGLNNEKMGYTYDTSAGLLPIRLLESHLLKQRINQQTRQRNEKYNTRNSLSMVTRKPIQSKRNHCSNHWFTWAMENFKIKLVAITGNSTTENRSKK